MVQFVSNYVALAGPAVVSALTFSIIAYFLLGGRDMSLPHGLMWKVAGYGVLSAMAVSIVMALAGYSSSSIPAAVGVAVGVTAAFAVRAAKAK